MNDRGAMHAPRKEAEAFPAASPQLWQGKGPAAFQEQGQSLGFHQPARGLMSTPH